MDLLSYCGFSVPMMLYQHGTLHYDRNFWSFVEYCLVTSGHSSDTFGSSWVLSGPLGSSRVLSDPLGSFRVLSGPLGSSRVPLGSPLVPSGPLGSPRVPSGHFVVLSGPFGSSLESSRVLSSPLTCIRMLTAKLYKVKQIGFKNLKFCWS
jgi:hypothetical protein